MIGALHQSRRRQAARVFEYYRHLIDQGGSDPTRARSGKLVAGKGPASTASRTRRNTLATMLIIACLAILASLYITGGIMVAARSTSSAGEMTSLGD